MYISVFDGYRFFFLLVFIILYRDVISFFFLFQQQQFYFEDLITNVFNFILFKQVILFFFFFFILQIFRISRTLFAFQREECNFVLSINVRFLFILVSFSLQKFIVVILLFRNSYNFFSIILSSFWEYNKRKITETFFFFWPPEIRDKATSFE